MLRKNKKSFTIVEITIVILVIGVLAVVAMVMMPSMSEVRLSPAASKIQSDLRYAQQLATQLQRRVAIIFDVDNDTYSVYIEDVYGSGSWDFTKPARNPLTQGNFTVIMNAGDFTGVDISTAFFNGFNGLLFDRDGTPFGFDSNNPAAANPLSRYGFVVLNINKKYIIVWEQTGATTIGDTPPWSGGGSGHGWLDFLINNDPGFSSPGFPQNPGGGTSVGGGGRRPR